MALTTRVALDINLTVSDTCGTMTLTDTTADYGGSGKITVNNVTSVVIVVNLAGGSYFTYTFTVLNGTITAATLGLSGATPTNILSKLASTVWPFVATPFDLWKDYGVTLPDFADGVVEVDYIVAGNVFEVTFNYTTSKTLLVTCVSSECCIEEMGQKVDVNCECSDDSIWNFLRADTYLTLAKFAASKGNVSRATLLLNKANDLCFCECSC